MRKQNQPLRPARRAGALHKNLLAAGCAALALAGSLASAQAANVVWVSDYNDPATGFGPAGNRITDSGFITLLQNAGHNVIRYNAPGAATTAIPQVELDALNTNDLIIIGRANGSGAFRLLQGNQWNTAVTKPLICMSPYLVRTIADNRMGWFVGEVGPDDTTAFATAVDPANSAVDYLLGGTAMLGNSTVSRYNEMLDRNTSHILGAPVAGGRSLITATFAQENNGTIATGHVVAEFPAGTIVNLSNAPLAAYRMYFAGGSREGGQFPNAIPLYTGRENLTPAGESIFLRSVNLALNSGTPPATDPLAPMTIVSQPSDASVAQGQGARFRVETAGAAARTLQWQRDVGDGVTFTNIPDAFTPFLMSQLTLPVVGVEDNGAKFRVEATNPNGVTYSDVVTLNVTADTAPPVALSATTVDGLVVTVHFDETVTPLTGGDTFNYEVVDSGGAVISGVALRPDGKSVDLTLDIPASANFTVVVENVEDFFLNPMPRVELTGVNLGMIGASIGALNGGGAQIGLPGGRFQVSAGGQDFRALTEEMRLVYKQVSGNFDARIRVHSITGTNRLESVAKAILNVRASTDAAAPSVSSFVTTPTPGDSTFGSIARATQGGMAVSNFLATAYVAQASTPATFPAWLRVKRTGNNFTTHASNNGTDWTQLGAVTVAMTDPVLVGAGVNSHRNGQVVDVVFSGFEIVPVAAAPTLVNSSYTAGTFGASFQSEAGFSYRVQYKDDLNAAVWTDLTTIAGDGSMKSISDTASANRFYRVVTP